jgi:hypothetical protein
MSQDKNREFYFSNSALSSFNDKYGCKLNWYNKWITRDIPRDPPSEQMLKGIYFETKAFGENASGSELPDVSFLYSAKGEPKVELVRINEQVDRFKELFNPSHPDFLGFTITGQQMTLINEELKVKGVLDFMAEDEFGNDCLFDLKFTADAENSFGDYAWGKDPSDINWDQQILYRKLYKDTFGKYPKMYVLVFDASPRKNIKLFELNITDNATVTLIEKYEDAWYFVNKYKEEGWPTYPSESNCSRCHLECSMRFSKPTVEKTRVNVL